MKQDKNLDYKNLPIHSAPFVHEKVFDIIVALNLTKDSKILILGSGSGSFDSRLIDFGYINIYSVDYSDEYNFKDNVTFLQRDLNDDFTDIGKDFDLIICIEIIEHLENHTHFLKNISTLLNKSGKVIVTSPNVENTYSRIKFLFLGFLSYFNKNDLKGEMVHINPIFEHIFLYNSERSNLRLLDKTFNCNVYKAQMQISFSRKILSVFLLIVSFLLPKRNNEGEINIYLLEKSS